MGTHTRTCNQRDRQHCKRCLLLMPLHCCCCCCYCSEFYNCSCAFDSVDYLHFKCMSWFERQNHQNVDCGMHYEWALSMQQKNIYIYAHTHGDNILPLSTRHNIWELHFLHMQWASRIHTRTQLAHACLLTYSLTIIHTQTNALIVYAFIHLKLSHITYFFKLHRVSQADICFSIETDIPQ